ncbi:MAG TPA: MarR family transcriptional regulator [Atopostipes sp.]|nr:MarR family transcriptional regulator [Atopostipes sp.]
MARTVDISEMLQKITAFNTQFLQAKREILSRENINASAINLISIIGDETMTLKEITAISELDKSTVSRQINLLVKDGLVHREIGEDKRFSFFELTEQAKAIYRQYENDFVQFIESTLQGWSEEEKQMFTVLIGRANYSFSNSLSK